MFWRAFWGNVLPDRPEYRFIDHGTYLENPHATRPEDMRLDDIRRPAVTSIDAVEAAMIHSSTLVRATPKKWGLEVGFSIPGTMTAWFALDDYSAGKFASAGVLLYRGVAFGVPSIIRGDLEDVARVAFAYGIPQDDREFIRDILSTPFGFPLTKRVENLWGNIMNLAGIPVLEGLLRLQRLHGVNLKTTLAATKTIEALLQ